MDKQIINLLRSRARREIHTSGGRVCGMHPTLPIVYAIEPVARVAAWPVVEVVGKCRGVRKITRTSNIDGCTVIWR